jgi:hypothetical protein
VPAPSASVAQTVPAIAPEAIAKAVNPKSEPPYAGPTGAIRGTVTIRGDLPALQEDVLAKIPEQCKEARQMYARPFREGMMHALADALVAVTEYAGYVPGKREPLRVTARGCAWDSRTLALTFGQLLEVVSRDPGGNIPKLVGTTTPAQLVAIPGGDPVSLVPTSPGKYTLTDLGKPFMTADVFVLKYATFDVTGLDGRYEIAGIPAGQVNVSAFLPATMATEQRRVTIRPGQTSEENFELDFDAKQYAEAVASRRAKQPTAAPR